MEQNYTIYQVRCYNCQKLLTPFEQPYESLLLQPRMTVKDALDSIGLMRVCCRTRMQNPVKLFHVVEDREYIEGHKDIRTRKYTEGPTITNLYANARDKNGFLTQEQRVVAVNKINRIATMNDLLRTNVGGAPTAVPGVGGGGFDPEKAGSQIIAGEGAPIERSAPVSAVPTVTVNPDNPFAVQNLNTPQPVTAIDIIVTNPVVGLDGSKLRVGMPQIVPITLGLAPERVIKVGSGKTTVIKQGQMFVAY